MFPLFATGINNASKNGGQICLRVDVVDTGGKFATGVSLIPVVHLDLRISPPIFKTI
jgi:hypothetical protein